MQPIKVNCYEIVIKILGHIMCIIALQRPKWSTEYHSFVINKLVSSSSKHTSVERVKILQEVNHLMILL